MGREKSRDCSARNSTNPDRDQLATVLKSCTTLSSDRPAQEDTAVPRLAPSSGSHQSSLRARRQAAARKRDGAASQRGLRVRSHRRPPPRPPCGPPSASLAHITRRMRGHLVEISSNHCKALRALRPCSCRLNGIQPVSRHREPGTARGRKGMKTQPRGRLPQIGAVSTHARMQTARDCTLAPHTHQVS